MHKAVPHFVHLSTGSYPGRGEAHGFVGGKAGRGCKGDCSNSSVILCLRLSIIQF